MKIVDCSLGLPWPKLYPMQLNFQPPFSSYSWFPTPDSFFYLCEMRPDYPHKLFADGRGKFSLLMEALAMDSI